MVGIGHFCFLFPLCKYYCDARWLDDDDGDDDDDGIGDGDVDIRI